MEERCRETVSVTNIVAFNSQLNLSFLSFRVALNNVYDTQQPTPGFIRRYCADIIVYVDIRSVMMSVAPVVHPRRESIIHVKQTKKFNYVLTVEKHILKYTFPRCDMSYPRPPVQSHNGPRKAISNTLCLFFFHASHSRLFSWKITGETSDHPPTTAETLNDHKNSRIHR